MAKIKTALVSVSDKTGIINLAKGLADLGIKIMSTGGTAKSIRENGIEVTDVSEYTGFPEIMDGRGKDAPSKYSRRSACCKGQRKPHETDRGFRDWHNRPCCC